MSISSTSINYRVQTFHEADLEPLSRSTRRTMMLAATNSNAYKSRSEDIVTVILSSLDIEKPVHRGC